MNRRRLHPNAQTAPASSVARWRVNLIAPKVRDFLSRYLLAGARVQYAAALGGGGRARTVGPAGGGEASDALTITARRQWPPQLQRGQPRLGVSNELPHTGFGARVLRKSEDSSHSYDAMPKPSLLVFDFCEHVVTSTQSCGKYRIEYLARLRVSIAQRRNRSTSYLRGDEALFARRRHLRRRFPIQCDHNADSEVQ
jgi:hypothetical protein